MVLTGYGGLGQVVETLPAGFAYAGSDLSESQVAVVGQTVTFTLLGEETFTYAVTAPAAEGSYVFSGIIKDVNRVEASVVGTSSIRVGPPPTPTPTPTPTPAPTLTRAPTSTPWPTPTPTPTLAPTPTATSTPEPTAAPATTAPPAPPAQESSGGGVPAWMIVLVVVGVVLVVGAAVAYGRKRRW